MQDCPVCGKIFKKTFEKQRTCGDKACSTEWRRNNKIRSYKPGSDTEGEKVRFYNLFLFWPYSEELKKLQAR